MKNQKRISELQQQQLEINAAFHAAHDKLRHEAAQYRDVFSSIMNGTLIGVVEKLQLLRRLDELVSDIEACNDLKQRLDETNYELREARGF